MLRFSSVQVTSNTASALCIVYVQCRPSLILHPLLFSFICFYLVHWLIFYGSFTWCTLDSHGRELRSNRGRSEASLAGSPSETLLVLGLLEESWLDAVWIRWCSCMCVCVCAGRVHDMVPSVHDREGDAGVLTMRPCWDVAC